MSVHKEAKRITTQVVHEMKHSGEKIAMLTAYDYTMATVVDQAGVDIILDAISVCCRPGKPTRPNDDQFTKPTDGGRSQRQQRGMRGHSGAAIGAIPSRCDGRRSKLSGPHPARARKQ